MLTLASNRADMGKKLLLCEGLQNLQYAYMCTFTWKHAHTIILTRSSVLGSHRSVAFHPAHYQKGNLSLAVTRPHTRVIATNYTIRCLSRAKRGEQCLQNQFSQQGMLC